MTTSLTKKVIIIRNHEMRLKKNKKKTLLWLYIDEIKFKTTHFFRWLSQNNSFHKRPLAFALQTFWILRNTLTPSPPEPKRTVLSHRAVYIWREIVTLQRLSHFRTLSVPVGCVRVFSGLSRGSHQRFL